MTADYSKNSDIRTVVRLQVLLTETIRTAENIRKLRVEFISMGLNSPDGDIKTAADAIGNISEELYKILEIKTIES